MGSLATPALSRPLPRTGPRTAPAATWLHVTTPQAGGAGGPRAPLAHRPARFTHQPLYGWWPRGGWPLRASAHNSAPRRPRNELRRASGAITSIRPNPARADAGRG